MQDVDLFIKRLKAKDPSSFEELIKRFGPKLLQRAIILVKDSQEAEELVCDTLAEAYLSIKRFKGESSIFRWLWGILLNLYRLHCRRSRKEKFLTKYQEPKIFPQDENNKKVTDAFSHTLPRLLKGLSHKHREIIILRYMDELAISDIAKILKIPEGTVKSRLFNAIQNLRKILKQMNFFPQDVT